MLENESFPRKHPSGFPEASCSLLTLNLVSSPLVNDLSIDCIVLVHNELRILEEFFRHYRALGVTRFFVVDDRSTDGTLEWLKKQPDVMIFTPAVGTEYRTHKKLWRSEILDKYCHDRWVLSPDADEWFVYKDMETKSLALLIAELEEEGARALPAVMVDMYRDAPLDKHTYDGGGLLDAFPLFDAKGYYEFPAPAAFRKKYPCPDMMYTGGMRHRIFQSTLTKYRPLCVLIFKIVCRLPATSRAHAPLKPLSALERFFLGVRRRFVLPMNSLSRKIVARYCFGSDIKALYNCTKLPLVKWSKGLHFNGGAHALSQKMCVSKRRSVMLHFKFTGGIDQIAYIVERKSHADKSMHYRKMIESSKLKQSPVCPHSTRYLSSDSLGHLLT
jgi:hypothetical protein